eukprot:406741-Rhodomonas_salina.1
MRHISTGMVAPFAMPVPKRNGPCWRRCSLNPHQYREYKTSVYLSLMLHISVLASTTLVLTPVGQYFVCTPGTCAGRGRIVD